MSSFTGSILIHFDPAIPPAVIREHVYEVIDRAWCEVCSADATSLPDNVVPHPSAGSLGMRIMHALGLQSDDDVVALARMASTAAGPLSRAAGCAVLSEIADTARVLSVGAAVTTVTHGVTVLGLSVTGSLFFFGGLALVFNLAYVIFGHLSRSRWSRVGRDLQHDLRVALYDHVQHLELSYFRDKSRGELVAVLSGDVNHLEPLIDASWQLLRIVVNSTITAAALFYVSPTVAAVTLVVVPVLIWISRRYQPLLQERYGALGEQAGMLSGELSGSLDGIDTIKSFVAESRHLGRVARASDEYRVRSRAALDLTSGFHHAIEGTLLSGLIGATLFAAHLISAGVLSVGELSALGLLVGNLLYLFPNLGSTVDDIERGLAAFGRVRRILELPIEADDGRPLDLSRVAGEIVYDRVTFMYRDDTPVLRDATLRFPAGRTTGIVGLTGSGKSTLLKLLLRFYEPDDGVITLDGENISAIRKSDLRRSIAAVDQDVFLFGDTVAANLRLADPTASSAELADAARVAGAADFIAMLPRGFETSLAERGLTLSGGQRQRLAIARAVLKPSRVVVFDEATSSLDSQTEAAVQRALRQRFAGKTVIVIAHRLSTVQHADHIYVLQEGTVIEQGTHEELLLLGGQYRFFWDKQTARH